MKKTKVKPHTRKIKGKPVPVKGHTRTIKSPIKGITFEERDRRRKEREEFMNELRERGSIPLDLLPDYVDDLYNYDGRIIWEQARLYGFFSDAEPPISDKLQRSMINVLHTDGFLVIDNWDFTYYTRDHPDWKNLRNFLLPPGSVEYYEYYEDEY